MNNIVNELLKHCFTSPALLDQVDPDWLRRGDGHSRTVAEILQTAIELRRKEVVPTPQNVASQDVEDPASILDFINQCLEVDAIMGWTYVLAQVKEDFTTMIYQHIGLEVTRMVNEGASNEDVGTFIANTQREIPSRTSGMRMEVAVDNSFRHFERVYSGEVPGSWVTGNNRLDNAFMWGPRNIALMAALQKSGKSRAVFAICMALLKNQTNLNLEWFNFEMSQLEMVACSIGNKLGLNTNIILGKAGMMPSTAQRELIMRTRNELRSMPIRFHSGQMRIGEIKRIAARNATENTIVVIDNLGLIKGEPGLSDNQQDDLVAKELVSIRDEYGPLIIPIHHLSKESTSHFNKDEHYEPDVRHIRGSARIADYANFVGLIHRPEMFEDKLREIFGEVKWQQFIGKMLVKMARGRDADPIRIMMDHQLNCCRITESAIQP